MTKTKEFTIDCANIRVSPRANYCIEVTVYEPDVDDLLSQLHEEDVIEHVQSNIKVEDVYPADILEDWAERNGYVKG